MADMFYATIKPIIDMLNGRPPSPGVIAVWVLMAGLLLLAYSGS